MSALVSSVVVLWLVPVRGDGRHVHYVRRVEWLGFDPEDLALCGRAGKPDRYGRCRWRRARAPGGVCQACHAAACARPTRVAWG